MGFFPEEFLDFLRARHFIAYDIISEGIPIYDMGFFAKAKSLYQQCLDQFKITKETEGWRQQLNTD